MTIDGGRIDVELALGSRLSELEWEGLVARGDIEDFIVGEVSAEAIADSVRVDRSQQRSAVPARSERPTGAWHNKRMELLGKLYGTFAEQEPAVVRLRARLDPDRPTVPALGRWLVERYYAELGTAEGDVPAELHALGMRRAAGERLVALWYEVTGSVYQLQVPERSVLGAIATVAGELSASYRWHEWESTRWLLCEGSPPLPQVFRWWPQRLTNGETDTPTRLLIEVDPILTSAEVGAAYAAVRSTFAPHERLRPLNDKALALAEFGLGSPEDESWDHLRSRWNEGPGRRLGVYRSDGGGPSNFRRDVRNALRRLMIVGWQ
jgi:hypothetical protein